MARTTELSDKMKEERKKKILSGALKLFAHGGLAATKISDIAKETGMSQGLVYHYYDNKEEIFIELISFAFQQLVDACRLLENMNTPPEEKIKIAIQEILNGLKSKEDNAYYHQIIAQASASSKTPAAAINIITKYNKIPYQMMEKIFQDGQKTSVFHEDAPKDQAKLFWNLINGFALHRFSHGKKAEFTDFNILYRIFIKEQ